MQSRHTATSDFTAPPFALLATEPLRALFDFCAAKLGHAPSAVGDGHPVVVYPGLGGGALTTSHLRSYLNECGFAAHDWQGGINTGPDGTFDDWLQSLVERVRELHRLHGRKVSLIGWSLGGVYAREVAKCCPKAVRQVITLATPFSSMSSANHARTIYGMLGGDSAQLTPGLEARLRQCPPVPTTSIYSKADGVVCWRGCLERESDSVENIEVGASHLGMGAHPEVLRIIVNRLALPEGQWRAYRRRRRSVQPASGSPLHEARRRSGQHDQAESDAVPGKRREAVSGDVA
jgi:pimeloyl-ACP methyl ester carboxylesterase